MNRNKFLSLALSLVMVSSLTVPAFAAQEKDVAPAPCTVPEDVSPDAWYYPAVSRMMELGYLHGTPNGFEPDSFVTIAQVYQTLYNIEGNPVQEGTVVTENAWFKDAMNWAGANGLYKSEEFHHYDDMPMRRAPVAAVIADYCALRGCTVTETHGAANAPDYASIPDDNRAGVDFCYDAKIMVGDNHGMLSPITALTRAQWAQILTNLEAFLSSAEKPAA